MAKSKGKSISGATALAGAVPGLEALKDVVGTLTQLAGTLKGFVEAISPGTILEFNSALRDLQATIGSAFVGAFNIISSVVREIGGVLLPVMQRLAPIINTVAANLGDQLLGAVKIVAAGLEAIAPILAIIADAEREFARFLLDLVSIIVVVIRTVSQVLSAFFGGGDLKDVFKSFVDIIRQVVRALITFAATLAVFAGFRDTVRSFADNLAKEAADREARAGGLKAAGTNPQITDVAALVRQAQLAAFTAAGGGATREKTDTEWLKDIATAVKDTSATKKSFEEAVSDWWKKEVIGGGGILGTVLTFINTSSARITRFLARF